MCQRHNQSFPAPNITTTDFRPSSGVLVLLLVTIFIVCAVSVIGNSLLLVTVFKRLILRRLSYFLVLALAAEDIFTSAVVLALYPQALIIGDWVLGQESCVMQGFLTTWLALVELSLMTAVSMDRYFACCRPLYYVTNARPSRFKIVIAFCWIYSFVVTLLPVFGCSSYKYDPLVSCCQVEWSSRPIPIVCVSLLGGIPFVSCTVITILCHYRVLKQVRKVTQGPAPGSLSDGGPSVSLSSTKATWTVTLMTGSYLICWLPYLAVRGSVFFFDWYKTTHLQQVLSALQRTTLHLFLLSKVTNPIIYGAYNQEFRNECKNLFMNCRVR